MYNTAMRSSALEGSVPLEDGFSISVQNEPQKLLLTLNDEARSALVARACYVAEEGFGRSRNGDTRGIYDHLFNAHALALLYHDDTLVELASCKHHRDEDIFYVHGVVMLRNIMGRGLGTHLIKVLLKGSQFRRIALTTQDPRVFHVLNKIAKKVVPSPTEPQPPRHLQDTAVRLTQGRQGSSLDPNTFVLRSLYKECLYDTIPQSRDGNVSHWFTKSLNIQDGLTRDGFLFIGELE